MTPRDIAAVLMSALVIAAALVAYCWCNQPQSPSGDPAADIESPELEYGVGPTGGAPC